MTDHLHERTTDADLARHRYQQRAAQLREDCKGKSPTQVLNLYVAALDEVARETRLRYHRTTEDCKALEELLEARNARVEELESLGSQDCPCVDGQPDPCTLCGATAEGVCGAGNPLALSVGKELRARVEELEEELRLTADLDAKACARVEELETANRILLATVEAVSQEREIAREHPLPEEKHDEPS